MVRIRDMAKSAACCDGARSTHARGMCAGAAFTAMHAKKRIRDRRGANITAHLYSMATTSTRTVSGPRQFWCKYGDFLLPFSQHVIASLPQGLNVIFQTPLLSREWRARAEKKKKKKKQSMAALTAVQNGGGGSACKQSTEQEAKRPAERTVPARRQPRQRRFL